MKRVATRHPATLPAHGVVNGMQHGIYSGERTVCVGLLNQQSLLLRARKGLDSIERNGTIPAINSGGGYISNYL